MRISCGSDVELQCEPLRWGWRLLCETVASVESFLVGTWLSLVEHSLGVRGVGSSNLPVPTNNFGLNDYFWRSILWRISGHNSLMMLLRAAASSWVAQFSAVLRKPRSCAG
jgi:hypothetical protein